MKLFFPFISIFSVFFLMVFLYYAGISKEHRTAHCSSRPASKCNFFFLFLFFFLFTPFTRGVV